MLLPGRIRVEPVGLPRLPGHLLQRLALAIDDVEMPPFSATMVRPRSWRWSASGWFGMMIDFHTWTWGLSNCGSRRVPDVCCCHAPTATPAANTGNYEF